MIHISISIYILLSWARKHRSNMPYRCAIRHDFRQVIKQMVKISDISIYKPLWILNSLRPSDAHICIGKLTSIGSDNGLSPGRRQAITWTNTRLLSIGLLVTSFGEIWIRILSSSLKKIHWKMLSAQMAAILFRGRWLNQQWAAGKGWFTKTTHDVIRIQNQFLLHTKGN